MPNGYGDNSDAFPTSPNEWFDSDGDKVVDNGDGLPFVALGDRLDNDDDGFPDDCDAECESLGLIADADDDNDGVEDTIDAFPLDPNESIDTDLDGIGNNADKDDDGDGLTDEQELFAGSDPLDESSPPDDSNNPTCGSECYSVLDFDADGSVEPLCDGVLLIRHLFGFSSGALVAGALGDGAQREDPDEIAGHIDALIAENNE